jgi:hypothetical protein
LEIQFILFGCRGGNWFGSTFYVVLFHCL